MSSSLQRLPDPAELRPGKLTPRRRRLFLAALARGQNQTEACRAAGVAYRAIQWALARDDDFARERAEAYAQGPDRLEAEAQRRGYEGVDDQVMYQGERCYERELALVDSDPETGEDKYGWRLKLNEDGQPIPIVKKVYSDNLLKFVLEARDPGRYRDKRLELTGAGGGPVRTHLTVEFIEPGEVA